MSNLRHTPEYGPGSQGDWWRSLETRDAASGAPEAEFDAPMPPADGIDRRSLLKTMAASLTMSVTACALPAEEIVPYVDMPEGLVPGEPMTFATALPLLGPAAPALAVSHEGRPTKLDGNPDHPWSNGGSDAFLQAAVLSLYDPDRARTPVRGSEIQPWDRFLRELADRRRTLTQDGGSGLRILSGAVLSPTLARQKAALEKALPRTRWHRWQPVNADNARAGARMAFGRPLDTLIHLDRARIVLCLDADILGPGPSQARHAADFATVRRTRAKTRWLARLYMVEPSLTITGAQADRRLALRPGEVAGFAAALAARIEGEPPSDEPGDEERAFLDAIARELTAQRGAALVTVGESQPPEVHALGHWINAQIGALGSTVDMIEPVEADPVAHKESIASLAKDMKASRVETLVILGGNPAYDAPADLGFAEALENVPFSMHLGLHEDETSWRCLWHLPESHPLEGWSDTRAPDGGAAIVQPLITPLFETRSAHEVVAMLAGDMEPSGHAIVQETWRADHERDFEGWWRETLKRGAVADSTAAPADAGKPQRPAPVRAETASGGFDLLLHPDASVWDGRFANNAWLQELPRPLSKVVWGNPLHVATADAEKLGLEQGDVVRLNAGGRDIEAPVFIAPGQAEGALSLALGYGRCKAGTVGSGVGVNAYPLRSFSNPWVVSGVTLAKTGRHEAVVTTQTHHAMQGRDIVRRHDLTELTTLARKTVEPASLFPDFEYETYAWAMVIDQSVCTGCNACVAACQAENNVPVVGPEEVKRGRDMHWLRVDRYYGGAPEKPEVFFQPVACMQCEKAPCEPVCPVEASVHDGEGLNVQVYNRCVGTRFCQSNCPYKVRRFNWYGYANGQEYANLGNPLYDAVSNPDVTVRARGVMEKCTYCVQRISRARRKAKKENRRIAEGEVVTACQAACPAQAIHFGDKNREDGHIAALRREPHAYGLLEHLGTRPRTAYLAMVRDGGSGKKGQS